MGIAMFHDLGLEEGRAIMVYWSGGRVDSNGLGSILWNQSSIITPLKNTDDKCKAIGLRQLWMNCTSYTGEESLLVVYDVMFLDRNTVYGPKASWHTALQDVCIVK